MILQGESKDGWKWVLTSRKGEGNASHGRMGLQAEAI